MELLWYIGRRLVKRSIGARYLNKMSLMLGRQLDINYQTKDRSQKPVLKWIAKGTRIIEHSNRWPNNRSSLCIFLWLQERNIWTRSFRAETKDVLFKKMSNCDFGVPNYSQNCVLKQRKVLVVNSAALVAVYKPSTILPAVGQSVNRSTLNFTNRDTSSLYPTFTFLPQTKPFSFNMSPVG